MGDVPEEVVQKLLEEKDLVIRKLINESKEQTAVILRLTKENTGLRHVIEESKRLLAKANPDLERLSLRGACKALHKMYLVALRDKEELEKLYPIPKRR